jgi:hypothetical protein
MQTYSMSSEPGFMREKIPAFFQGFLYAFLSSMVTS